MTANVLVLVEGLTEEVFVRDVLSPHLDGFSVYVQPVNLGGVSSWQRIKRELRLLCRNSDKKVTTLLDLYGLPPDTPGLGDPFDDPRLRVQHVEESMNSALASPNLKAHVQLHEFEAFLFVDVDATAHRAGKSHKEVRAAVASALKTAPEPELIDDGPNTAPSKRIGGAWKEFVNHNDGLAIVSAVGLDRLRTSCPHFGQWLTWLESLGTTQSQTKP